MIRSLTPATCEVGVSASRAPPYTAIAASISNAATGASHGRRVTSRSSISTAGAAKIATLRKVSPHSPSSDADCASARGSVSA